MVVVVGVVIKTAHKATGVYMAVPTPGATVQLSNSKLGTLEVINNHLVPLAPGVYDVVISAPGYKPFVGQLRVETGEPRTFSEGLVPDTVDGAPGTTASPGETGPDGHKPDAPSPSGIPSPPPEAIPAPSPSAGSNPETGDSSRPNPGSGGLIVKEPGLRKPDPPTVFSARFVTEQPGVEILVSGRSVGKTPNAEVSNLRIGQKYTVTAVLAGYKTYDGEFTSKGDAHVRVPIELEKEAPPPTPHDTPPPPSTSAKSSSGSGNKRSASHGEPHAKGRLACSSIPVGADIFVDGRPTGRQTPVPINAPLELGVGTHKVVFKFAGKSSLPQSVQIKENEVSRLLNVQIQ